MRDEGFEPRPRLAPYPDDSSRTPQYRWRWGRLLLCLFACSLVIGAGGRVGWELTQEGTAVAEGNELEQVSARLEALQAEVRRQRELQQKQIAAEARTKARKTAKLERFWASTYPFPAHNNRHPIAEDELPRWWESGDNCASYEGCEPEEALAAWPLRPFRQPRPIISFFDDARPSSLHHGIDIAARTGEKVYAIQPGYAHIIEATGYDARVQVGDFIYWHIDIEVTEGQYVEPLKTVVGRVQPGFGHLHLAEVDASGAYINPVRPGYEILPGWSDRLAPVIGDLHVSEDGRADVAAYDRQSLRWRRPYITPPTSLAGLAYRLWERGSGGRLHFAYRGTRNHEFSELPLIYEASPPFDQTKCYQRKHRCPYGWRYVLAGGFAPELPRVGVEPGRYVLSVYAWDWTGNATARDFILRFDGSTWRHIGS